MKKIVCIILLLASLAVLFGCGGNNAVTLEEIANESTDIVRANLVSRQADTSTNNIQIAIQGAYKGSLQYRDIIEVRLPYYDLDIFGQWTFYLLFFLNITEGEVAELAFANYSVYLLDMCERVGSHNFTFINASPAGYPSFTIEYQELMGLWRNHMQEIYDTSVLVSTLRRFFLIDI